MKDPFQVFFLLPGRRDRAFVSGTVAKRGEGLRGHTGDPGL